MATPIFQFGDTDVTQTTGINAQRQANDETFEVVLKGLRSDIPSAEAKIKLAALFKATVDQVTQLLATGGYVVKKGVTQEVGTSYKRAIDAAGGLCELVSEAVPVISLDVDLPFDAPPVTEAAGPLANASGTDSAGPHSMEDSLGVFKQKISKHNAHLGVLVGFGVFAFALFLPWASIPAGLMARDGGSVDGWSESAYFALVPLALALYPVFLHRSVQLKTLLINIAIAFALLGYNNVANRNIWQNAYGNMGSIMGAGFWLGLLALVAISVCGIAWSLHTSEGIEKSNTLKSN
ncbi:hypothetical protein [Rhodoferax sp.]|uniref:hypothetical protein n=1 Tax=Rhodoferax sp. TaxID=50421 RepID=UPI00276E1F68|nr:hypothetical protein [Rhodoferax sp.]